MDGAAPAIISHPNHSAGTLQRKRAAAATRKQMADVIPRTGVRVFSRSPRWISVRVPTANGQMSLPPTHHGGGAPPGWRGTIAVRLSCAPRRRPISTKIHIEHLL